MSSQSHTSNSSPGHRTDHVSSLCALMDVSGPSEIVWGHAVNSLQALESVFTQLCLSQGEIEKPELKEKPLQTTKSRRIHMIEFDLRTRTSIITRHQQHKQQEQPPQGSEPSQEATSLLSTVLSKDVLTSHDPAEEGHPSITEWLTKFEGLMTKVPSSVRLGLKFDFKDQYCVAPVVKHLISLLHPSLSPSSSSSPSLSLSSSSSPCESFPGFSWRSVPIWLNADILQGPYGKPPGLIPDRFLSDCAPLITLLSNQAASNVPMQGSPTPIVLSLGWTSTNIYPYKHIKRRYPSSSPSPSPPPSATFGSNSEESTPLTSVARNEEDSVVHVNHTLYHSKDMLELVYAIMGKCTCPNQSFSPSISSSQPSPASVLPVNFTFPIRVSYAEASWDELSSLVTTLNNSTCPFCHRCRPPSSSSSPDATAPPLFPRLASLTLWQNEGDVWDRQWLNSIDTTFTFHDLDVHPLPR